MINTIVTAFVENIHLRLVVVMIFKTFPGAIANIAAIITIVTDIAATLTIANIAAK